LKEVLKEKDHIIQKLMDRMEAMGTDLGQIFPQANMKGGRKVDKARAEEKVRGLRPFDMESWRKEAGDLANVFTDDTNFDLSLDSVAKENWWETVRGSRIDISKNRASLSRTQSKPALKQKESSEDDDGFQVQLTPPGRASKGSVALDDSMREEDLGAPSQLSKVPDSFPQPEALSRQKFGILGGQKDEPKKPLPITDVSTDDEEIASPRSKQIGAVKLTPEEETSTDDEELPMTRSKQQSGKMGRQKPSLLEETSTDDDEVPLPYPTKQLGRVEEQNVPLLDEDDVSLPRSNQQFGMAGKQQAHLLENASTDDDEPGPSKSGRAKDTQPDKGRATPLADEETTDDDAPAPALPRGQSLTKSPSPPPPKTSTTMKTKLGTLGGKKEPPPPVEKPNLKKGKLGQVGGKKKESTPPVSAPSSPEDPPTQTPKRKLGAIGGRHKAAHEGNDVVDAAVRESTGRSLEVRALKDEAQPARETSEERVVKKRRELKRELEEKAKAHIKKKRKF
jgi:hypothetical protein